MDLFNAQLNVNCSAWSIKLATKIKYLGFIIDNKLNFKHYINFVKTKISKSVGILGKLKYYLDLSSLLNLYYALIHSHLNYNFIMLGNTYSSYLTKLQFYRIRQLGL